MAAPMNETCPQCGAVIDPSSSAEGTALCRSCVAQNADPMARARALFEKMKQPDPQSVFWGDVVNRVYKTPAGLGSLNAQEQVYFLVSCAEGEVYNGGLHQFFFNSAGNHYRKTVEALRLLGLTDAAELLEEAARLLFPDAEPPGDWDARRAVLPWWPDNPARPWATRLEELNKLFGGHSDAISERLARHAREHKLYPGA